MASISFRQNALSLDDILSEIFGYLKNVDLATCSQVCRTWNSSACRILWSDLPDLVPLLKVAGDLEPESRDDSFTVVSKQPYDERAPSTRVVSNVHLFAIAVCRELYLPRSVGSFPEIRISCSKGFCPHL